jgi:delta(3,5)-delta(2,4)-dienoyl-CoA isomerase
MRAILHDFQNAIGAPAPISQRETAAVHGEAFGLALDAVDVRQAASDAAFSTKEVDLGLVADMGTLARVPELVGNVSLLHEPSLRSWHTRGARTLWCCVARCAWFWG